MKNEIIIQTYPYSACPKCGNMNFAVLECNYTGYKVVNGEVIDFIEYDSPCIGVCTVCGSKYKMARGYDTFIPITPMRSILKEFQPEELEKTNTRLDFKKTIKSNGEMVIKNPMLKDGK